MIGIFFFYPLVLNNSIVGRATNCENVGLCNIKVGKTHQEFNRTYENLTSLSRWDLPKVEKYQWRFHLLHPAIWWRMFARTGCLWFMWSKHTYLPKNSVNTKSQQSQISHITSKTRYCISWLLGEADQGFHILQVN